MNRHNWLLAGWILIATLVSSPKAQGQPSSVAAGYEKLSAELTTLAQEDRLEYGSRDFVTNWILRPRSNQELRVTFGPEAEPTTGVRTHRTQVIIQLKPETTPDQLAQFTSIVNDKYRAEIVDAIPPIGVIIAAVEPGPPAAGAQLPANLANVVPVAERPAARQLLTLRSVIDQISQEPAVLTAAPNTLIETTTIPRASQGKGRDADGREHVWDWQQGPGTPAANQRDGNWGLKRAAFPQAWNFSDAIRRRNPQIATQRVRVGVLDTGFANHVDLRFAHSPATVIAPDDHGMHVAGIIGSTWPGEVGIEGASPFADIIVATMQNIPFSTTNVDSPAISLIISDVMSNIVKFIIEHPDVKVINLSLGYNWVANEGVDPNADQEIQRIVRDHGMIMRTIAELANERGIIIVSAAGNDSRPGQLPQPIEAKWGSPFNYAAVEPGMFETAARNVIVVESIGRPAGNAQDDPISPFSNVHGSLAAPGEGILSLVATKNPFRSFSVQPEPCNECYAAFDGTSMATPHVTGLIALMYAYNPQLTVVDVLRILDIENHRPLDTPAPVINAFDALVACRDESPQDLADVTNDGRVDMADFKMFRDHLRQVEGDGGMADLNGDDVLSANENIYPRADLNGDGQLSRTAKREIKGQERTDLEVMIHAWEDPGVAADSLPGLLDQ
jgi:subtilisin family serine protease